jgi:hypothetical protein
MSAGPGWFEGGAILSHAGGKFWRSMEQVTWQQQNGASVVIPPGVVFDGASIPSGAWSVIGHPLSGPYVLPALLHDYECAVRETASATVHRRFYHALRAQGVSWVRSTTMWAAVRVFGPRWPLVERV